MSEVVKPGFRPYHRLRLACKGGPILGVQPDGTWYYNVTEDNLERIVSEHLKHGRVVEDLVFHQGKPLNEAETP